MKTILFLTAAYPFFPGEQFIECEIDYWAAETSAKVVIVPLTASGIPRDVPSSIELDCSLAQKSSYVSKMASVLSAATSSIFWKEVRYIRASKKPKLRSYALALISVANLLRITQGLKKICTKHQGNVIAYSYWNEFQSYAATILKRIGLIDKVVSRAHGYDLYENRRLNNYMPLKRQFIKENEIILSISKQGKAYIARHYNVPPEHIAISPLGVAIPNLMCSTSPQNFLNIVSVSFCVSIKRIDKIIDAIAEAAIRLEGTNIQWRHIGDGPLLSVLEKRAAEKLTPLKIDWRFLGNLENSQVKEYFEKNPVDFFINTSESEGVPVSIMEAMSYGVPTIAPDVGGVAELVSNECGILLSQTPSISEIASSVVNIHQCCKRSEIRMFARQEIITKYAAKTNYRELIKLIVD